VIVGPDAPALWGAIAVNDGLRAGPASGFAAANLDVELRAIRGARERANMLGKGADLAVAPLSSLPALAAASGKPLVAVAVVAFDAGELALVASPRFHTLAELAGARVAAPRGNGAMTLAATLLAGPLLATRRATATEAPVRNAVSRIDGTRTAKEAAELFRRSLVDAVVLPAAERASLPASAHVVVSTKEARRAAPWVLVATQATADTRGPELTALIAAWLDGAGRARDAAPQIARLVGLAPEELRAQLSRVRVADAADNRLLLDAGSGLWDELAAAALIVDASGDPAVWPLRSAAFLPPAPPPAAPPSRIGDPHRIDGPLVQHGFAARFGPGEDRVSDVLAPDQPDLAGAADLLALFSGCPARLDAVVEPETSGPLARRRLRALTDALARAPGVDATRLELALRDTGRATSPPGTQRFSLVLCP
jgi:hypothetical protein